jgi:general stress protein YciG
MAAERRREIARIGGRAAHAKGRAHEFTSETGREAGRKGGTKVSQDRAYMAELGRRAVEKRYANRTTQAMAAVAATPEGTPAPEAFAVCEDEPKEDGEGSCCMECGRKIWPGDEMCAACYLEVAVIEGEA